jgi:hypothetical protein
LIPAKYYSGDADFFISESWKAARAIVNGPSAWFGAVLGLAVDVAAFSAQNVQPLLRKFQGPLEATFHAEFYTHGELYWKYDIDLEGKLELRYAKSGHPGEAVHFTGQFEGNGTRFTLWENFTALFQTLRATLPLIERYRRSVFLISNQPDNSSARRSRRATLTFRLKAKSSKTKSLSR